jgi:hypothetical protein
VLQVALHGEHFGHAVRDGRPGGEDYAALRHSTRWTWRTLRIHIEGPFAEAVCGSPAMRVILET